jgi:Tfp pilus assembly protein PilN
MIEINLLPVDQQVKAKVAQKGLGFEVPKFIPKGVGIAVALLAVMYTLANLRASSSTRNLTSTRKTLSDLTTLSEEAQAIEAKLPTLRDRAKVFRARIENRKVWSQILQEITLCCPVEIELTDISLVVPRTSTSATQSPKELLIKGFYPAAGGVVNSEMKFRDNLQKSEIVAKHYHNFIAMTAPQATKTDFTIRCTEL